MADLGGFDASQVEPTVNFEPVPAGEYEIAIIESAMKPTKSGSGQYLELVFQVIEGEHRGRQLWSRLNLENPSEMAVKIARAELSAICRAIDVLRPADSVQLHNLPLVIKVGCTSRADNGELTNEIKGYESRQRVEPAPSANSTPPWKR